MKKFIRTMLASVLVVGFGGASVLLSGCSGPAPTSEKKDKMGDGKMGDGKMGDGKMGDGKMGDGKMGDGKMGDKK